MGTTTLDTAAPGPTPRVQLIGFAAAAAASLIVAAMPAPEGLKPEGQRVLALLVAALVLWATEALPIAITAVLALVAQPVLGLASFNGALTSFISPVFFFVMAMYVIAHAWITTGLARRFALWMMAKAGTDARRAVWVFVVGTGLVSTVVSDVPCAAIFMVLALGIFGKLRLQPGSRFAKAVMLGIPIGSLIGGVGTPAGSSINVLGLMLIERHGGERVPFLHWMALGVPMVLVLLPLAAWVLVRFYPPEIASIGDVSDLTAERRAMGRISRPEWKLVGLMSSMLCLWLLGTWLPALDTMLVGITGACVMFLPGMRLFSWREVQHAIGWDTLVMLGGATSLGAASVSSGLAEWLVRGVLGGLQGASLLGVLMLIGVLTVLIHLILPVNPVINAVLVPPIMLLAKELGHEPQVYALAVVFTSSCAFLLPLDSVPMVTYSKGYYRMLDMVLPGAVISVAWVLLMSGLLWVWHHAG